MGLNLYEVIVIRSEDGVVHSCRYKVGSHAKQDGRKRTEGFNNRVQHSFGNHVLKLFQFV